MDPQHCIKNMVIFLLKRMWCKQEGRGFPDKLDKREYFSPSPCSFGTDQCIFFTVLLKALLQNGEPFPLMNRKTNIIPLHYIWITFMFYRRAVVKQNPYRYMAHLLSYSANAYLALCVVSSSQVFHLFNHVCHLTPAQHCCGSGTI